MKHKTYSIYLENKLIGTTQLEKADAPMGVVFGLIQLNGIETPYNLFKKYCLENDIVIDSDEPEHELIFTQLISKLKVVNESGIEIKDFDKEGSVISGMKDGGYEITIFGVPYPFFEEEFPHHVEDYKNRMNKLKSHSQI